MQQHDRVGVRLPVRDAGPGVGADQQQVERAGDVRSRWRGRAGRCRRRRRLTGAGAAAGGSLRAARAIAMPAPVSTRITAKAATAQTICLFRIVKTLGQRLHLDHSPDPAAGAPRPERGTADLGKLSRHEHPPPGPRGRLRRPVRPADRPPGAGGAGLLRDRAALDAGRRDARQGPGRDHPVRRPVERVRAGRARRSTPALFDAGVPVFGICYGFQAMAQALGGTVAHTGAARVRRHPLLAARGRHAAPRPARRPAGLDEPRRLRDRGAGRASR